MGQMKGVITDELKMSYGEAPYDIHIEAKPVGGDVFAAVTGGTRPHIGAVALAEPAGALHPVTGEPVPDGGQIRVATLVSAGHKDMILAEMFALGLCEKYGCNVCVSAGVHVDGVGKEEIALMVENAKALLDLI